MSRTLADLEARERRAEKKKGRKSKCVEPGMRIPSTDSQFCLDFRMKHWVADYYKKQWSCHLRETFQDNMSIKWARAIWI